MKYSDKPQFEHDCDGCKFLGHVMNHDMYFCAGEALKGYCPGTIILRYSSEGPDYRSGFEFCTEYQFNETMNQISDDHPLFLITMLRREALLRAITRGYVKPEEDKKERG